jgi:hypothetical protein
VGRKLLKHSYMLTGCKKPRWYESELYDVLQSVVNGLSNF